MDDLNVKGRIFDIQRYSIHDGNGIRTIVFLKGCAFRCRWCCNPESQEHEIQTMKVQGKDKIIGTDVTVSEVLEEVLKDRNYYQRSGGGVTLSGGEALCQPEFTNHLLHACKEEGLHTAMESTAFANYPVIERILPVLDQYLMDIKHVNSEKHRLFTGQGNELVLENARKIAASRETELIIRVPVIPTFNQTEAEIAAIAEFAGSLPGVKEMNLLPYHRLGQDKYDGLNREYALMGIMPPMIEEMEYLKKVAEKHSGLLVKIGG
ncbi:glycyl-radical enzyme activating protein [Lachnoclostridium phytofermentans]|uniref:Glycyl-radical enzyme activating protein family n=1 Tax=Lachnoclostridium phytofermentans (strain ATCC 700394 / DSM 18823 / ISDg) TaxID=357809 RepID=A9KN54_LACP7|nr:glycyl-radical enzyme activating protein family [Lachnoclostridium phytofermentans ISDg]